MSLVTVGGIAHAGGVNYAHAWETSFGARWNGYVQIQGSHDDNGRHAKSGYHRFTRGGSPAARYRAHVHEHLYRGFRYPSS